MAEVVGLIASVVTLSETAAAALRVIRAPEEVRTLQEQLQAFQAIMQLVQLAVEASPQVGDLMRSTLSRANNILSELEDIICNKLVRTDGSGVSITVSRTAWMRYQGRVHLLRMRLNEVWGILWRAICTELALTIRRVEMAIQQQAQASGHGAPRDIANLASDTTTPALTRDQQHEGDPIHNIAPAVRIVDKALHQNTNPHGQVECSPVFLPELYTVDEMTPALYSYGARNQVTSPLFIVEEYFMLYRDHHNPRRWLSLAVSVLRDDSSSWKFDPIGGSGGMKRNTNGLPKQLSHMLQNYLGEKPNLPSNVEITARLIGGPEPNFRLHEITTIQRPVSPLISVMSRLVFVGSRWVWGLRVTAPYHRHNFAYILRVLHCLRGKPRISTLVGVLVDDRGIVTSVLAELPAKGRLVAHCLAGEERPVAARRENWFRQAIEGVSEIHGQGFTIGNLATLNRCPLAIQADDSLVFHTNFDEYDWVVPSMVRERAPQSARRVTFEQDVFDLGLLLWWIAAGLFIHPSMPAWCRVNGCLVSTPGKKCGQMHGTPGSALPPVGESLPNYMDQVIAACRTEHPRDRPTARALLDMLPSSLDTSAEEQHVEPRSRQEDDGLYWWSLNSTGCKSCGLWFGTESSNFWHCNICTGGDFDLCCTCLDEGLFCHDLNHELREYVKGEGTSRYIRREHR